MNVCAQGDDPARQRTRGDEMNATAMMANPSIIAGQSLLCIVGRNGYGDTYRDRNQLLIHAA
jgi:hypothetical protein